jgi:hypothetical protein
MDQMNASDGVRGGLEVEEACAFAKAVALQGTCDLLVVGFAHPARTQLPLLSHTAFCYPCAHIARRWLPPIHLHAAPSPSLNPLVCFVRGFVRCVRACWRTWCPQVSGGDVQRNGFYMMRGRVPLLGMAAASAGAGALLKALLVLVFGPFFVQKLPYTQGFLLEEGKKVGCSRVWGCVGVID